MAETQNLTGTIAAYFDNSSDAREAVEDLRDAGFSSAHIGVAHRGQFANTSTQPGTQTTIGSRKDHPKNELSTWEKVKSWFSGDEPEPYADERTRGDLASHEVIDPDSPDGYESADLHGSFRNLDISDEQSRYFSHRLSSGNGAVVTVNPGARRADAEEILTRYDGDLARNTAGYDYRETSGAMTPSSTGRNYSDQPAENIQLLGEVLRVHKDRINRGDVRLRKEVVTENQAVQVPVTREELVIERRPGNEAAVNTGSIGENQEMRVPLSEERVSVDKSTVVREEVSVSKKPVEEVRDISDEVRHEELVVEDPNKRETDPNRRIA